MIVNELNLPISIEEFLNMVHAIENKVLPDVAILPGLLIDFLFFNLKIIYVNFFCQSSYQFTIFKHVIIIIIIIKL